MAINRRKFFDGIRSGPFPGKLTAGQVQGCNYILDEWERRGLTDQRWLAYILATVFWETGHTIQSVKEGGSAAYLKSKRYYPWYGRSYPQLTWKANYEKFRARVLKLFGVDIVENADNVLKPEVGMFILFEGMINGEFTNKKLANYFNKATDWVNARRIINGTDHAADIAAIAKQFYADLVQA